MPIPRDMTMRVAVVNAVFCFVTTALYVFAQMEAAPVLSTFLIFSPFVLVTLWLQQDARRTHLGDVHDWGFFLWLLWPIVMPWYAFKSRGRAGWRLLLALILLGFPTYVAAFVAYGILHGVRG